MTTHEFDIIGVGSPIVDSLAHVEDSFIASIGGAKGGMELVDADTIGTLMAKASDKLVEAPGGSAGNTTFALARLGLRTAMLGKLGNCAGAEFYKSAYEQMGGHTGRFKTANQPNGRCLSLITPDSERTMRTDLGAAMTLAPDEVSAEDFRGCRHAHIEGYLLFNRDLMRRVLDSAKEAGCTTSIDLASFEVVGAAKDILADVLKNDIDVVFANEEEAAAFTDLGDDYEGMVKQLAGLCDTAVVKLGKEGSLIAKGTEVHRIAPYVVNDAIDTTAAGDFWASGFLYGWLRGKDLPTCGAYGSRLGAEVVRVLGAAIPNDTWEKIKADLG